MPTISQQKVVEPEAAPSASPTEIRGTSRKYGVLRAAAIIYKIIGWVICVGGSIFAVAAAVMIAQGVTFLGGIVPEVGGAVGVGAAVVGIVGVVISVLGGLFLLAFADLCNVAVDLKSNTRQRE